MAEEVVLTRFIGDTSGLEASVATGTKAIDTYDKSVDNATKSTKDLSGSMGDAGKKVQMLGTQATTTATSIQKVGTGSKGIGGIFSDLSSKAKSAFAGIADSVKSVGGKIGSSIQAGASTALGGIGSFATEALSLLGPIGIAVAAVGGALVGIFANTDAGQTYFDGLKRSGGAAFDIITGKVTGFFSALTDGQTVIGKVFGFLGDAVDVVTKPLQFLIKGLGEITGISDFLSAANAQGQQLAKMYDDIDEAQTKNIVNNATLEKQVSALNIQLRNRSLSDQDRLKIGAQIADLEQQRSANEIKVLKQITAAKQQAADNELKDKHEVSDETKKELADAQAAEIRAAEESANIVDRAQNRVNAIKDAASARDDARLAKDKAAKDKAAADDLARQQKLDAAQQAADAAADKADAAARRARLTPADQQKFDLNAGVDEQLKTANEAFDKLRELNKGNADDIEIINADEAKTIVQINEVRNDALAKLDDDAAKKSLDAIHQATTDKTTLQKEEINKQFDDLEKQAKDVYALGQDQTDALVALEQARAKALSDVKTQAQLDDEKALKESQDRQVAIIQSSGQELANVLEQISSGQIKTAEDAGKQLAAITLDTVGSIVQAKIVEIIARSTAFGADAGPVGAAIGLAGGVAIGAIIKGLLAALKAQILGKATGEDYVSGPQMWAGRDGHLRRLDTGERVVRTKTNADNWHALQSMEEGTFQKWMDANHDPIFPDLSGMMALNFAPKLNKYLESPEGRRMSSEITLPGYFDRNIVAAHREATKQQKMTNDLLRAMLPGKTPQSRSRRYNG